MCLGTLPTPTSEEQHWGLERGLQGSTCICLGLHTCPIAHLWQSPQDGSASRDVYQGSVKAGDIPRLPSSSPGFSLQFLLLEFSSACPRVAGIVAGTLAP